MIPFTGNHWQNAGDHKRFEKGRLLFDSPHDKQNPAEHFNQCCGHFLRNQQHHVWSLTSNTKPGMFACGVLVLFLRASVCRCSCFIFRWSDPDRNVADKTRGGAFSSWHVCVAIRSAAKWDFNVGKPPRSSSCPLLWFCWRSAVQHRRPPYKHPEVIWLWRDRDFMNF